MAFTALGITLSALLPACGQESGDDPEPHDPIPNPLVNTWMPSSSQCQSDAHGLPLLISTEVEAEVEYLRNVVACAADEQYGPVWLHNVGNEAWVLNADSSAVEFVYSTNQADLLASGFPEQLLLLPEDQVVIDQTPREVSWDLSASVTIAWETEEEAIDQAVDLGTGLLISQLKKSHPKGAAVLACAVAAGEAAEAAADQPDEFESTLESSLGLAASGSKCATSWKQAWEERFAPTSDFLDRTSTQFRIYNRLARLLKIVIR